MSNMIKGTTPPQEIIKHPAWQAELKKHQHQYTIPVEWQYKGVAAEWGQAHGKWPVASRKRVTKLRCSCGSEVER